RSRRPARPFHRPARGRRGSPSPRAGGAATSPARAAPRRRASGAARGRVRSAGRRRAAPPPWRAAPRVRPRTAPRTPERRTRRRRPAPPLPTAASTSRPSRAPAPWSSEVGRDRHEERVVRDARLLPALQVELVVELDDGLEAVRPEVHAEGPALAAEAVEV